MSSSTHTETRWGLILAIPGAIVAVGLIIGFLVSLFNGGEGNSNTVEPGTPTIIEASIPTTTRNDSLSTLPTTTAPPSSVSRPPVPATAPVGTTAKPVVAEIGRVEVVPDEYARIARNTWAASRYANNTAPFLYGWNVYDPEGNRITRNVTCRVDGIVASGDGTPMGSRQGNCDYSSAFTSPHYLPPGNYRVTVTATMDAGSTKQATFDFTVVPG